MRKLLLLCFIPLLSGAQKDTSRFMVLNEIVCLRAPFIGSPFLKIEGDSAVFKMDKDSTIVIDQVWLHDTTKTWVHHAGQGDQDIWEDYIQNKYPDNSKIRKRLDSTPEIFIEEYFSDQKITLHGTVVYSSMTGPRKFSYCPKCYRGIDFLFKVDKSSFTAITKIPDAHMDPVKVQYFKQ